MHRFVEHRNYSEHSSQHANPMWIKIAPPLNRLTVSERIIEYRHKKRPTIYSERNLDSWFFLIIYF